MQSLCTFHTQVAQCHKLQRSLFAHNCSDNGKQIMFSISRTIELVQQSYKRYVLILLVGLAITAGTSQESQAQLTVDAGGFRIQFWSQGDGGGSGANLLAGTVADADLGTWTAAERTAVIRGFQYWTDRLNLPAATDQSPLIRVAKDENRTMTNAAASVAVLTTTGSGATLNTLSNTFNRIVTGANPGRVDGVDGGIRFDPGQTGGVVNTYGTDRVTQLNTQDRQIERTVIHEVGHLLGFNPFTTPFSNTFVGTTSAGANALAVFGAGVPLGPQMAHTDIEFENITRGTPFGLQFRNYPPASPAELAIFKDMLTTGGQGYTGLVLADNFGATFYQDGTFVQEFNATGFNSAENYGIGLFIRANMRDITQTTNLTASGFAATGIRLSSSGVVGPAGNLVTIAPGVTVAVNGEQGIGVLVSSGGNNFIAHRGTLNANGTQGRGFVFDFGRNGLSPQIAVTSADYNAPLVDSLDITGTISASTNAIEIGNSAAVGEINIMDGADISGDIFSDALIAGFPAPVLTFGKTADANGFATVAPDVGFTFTYAGDIFGASPQATLDIDTFGGTTTLNGAVGVRDVLVQSATTLISNNTFLANNLTVNNTGLLQLNNGFTLDGGATQIDNGGVLEALDYTMNTGTTNIDAGGLMTVTNAIDVQGGLFTLNGTANSISNSSNVGTLGTLMGTGTLDSNLTLNGTITPGNSIGTLTITGNLETFPTSTFNIETQASAAPVSGVDVDLIDVGGTATVDGGTVNIDGAAGAYVDGTVYRFLQTGGGLTVTQLPFYSDNIAGLRAVPFFDGNDLGFTIQLDIPFSTIGRTHNQKEFGRYFNVIQTNPDPNIQLIRNQLDALPSTDAILNAMDQLIGDVYASLPAVSIQNTSSAFRTLSRQQNNAMDISFSIDNERERVNDGWMVGYDLDSDVDFDGNAAALGYSSAGTHFGVANFLDDNSRIGFFGSYGQTSVKTSGPSQSVQSDNLLLGAFMHHHDGLSFWHVAGAVGFDRNKSTRRINFGNINETAHGIFAGHQGALLIERGYEFRKGIFRLQPVGSVQYVRYFQGEFSEKDATATNLLVSNLDASSFRSSFGANLSSDLRYGEKWATGTHFSGSWQHEFLDSAHHAKSTLAADNTNTFALRGLDFGRDWINLSAGISFARGNNFVLRFDYGTQFNSHLVSHTGTASLSKLW